MGAEKGGERERGEVKEGKGRKGKKRREEECVTKGIREGKIRDMEKGREKGSLVVQKAMSRICVHL